MNLIRMEDNIYELVARELTGKADEAESRQVGEWIKKDNNRLIYHAIDQHMNNGSAGSGNSQKEVFNRIVNRVNQETEEFNDNSRSVYMVPAWLKVAAVLVLAVGVSWLVFRREGMVGIPIAQNIKTEKSNPKGQKSSFVLSDGTLVKLNADSRLTFSEKFSKNSREVFLEGEAFFDVKKDPQRPFIVRTGKLSTTALGTSFNVQAYEGENLIKVSLVTGKVKVEQLVEGSSQETQKIILDPSEMASFNKESLKIYKRKFDSDIELGWKSQTLYFENQDLRGMVKTLERWYGVTFDLKDIQNLETSFTGKFKDKSLEYVLDVLSKDQVDFLFRIDEKKVTVFRN